MAFHHEDVAQLVVGARIPVLATGAIAYAPAVAKLAVDQLCRRLPAFGALETSADPCDE